MLLVNFGSEATGPDMQIAKFARIFNNRLKLIDPGLILRGPTCEAHHRVKTFNQGVRTPHKPKNPHQAGFLVYEVFGCLGSNLKVRLVCQEQTSTSVREPAG